GPFLVLRSGGDAVVAELPAQPGTTRRVGLKAGSYMIQKRAADGLLVGQVQLRAGTDAVLDESEMQRVPYAALSSKGGRAPGWFSLTGGLERGVAGVEMAYGVEAGYLFDLEWLALWPTISVVVGREEVDRTLSVAASSVKPSLAAVRLVRFSRLNLF